MIIGEGGGVSELVGRAETVERWPLVVVTEYNIPMMLDQPGTGHRITGEVYDVDQDMLDHLDVLEACPHLYSRRIIQVSVGEELMDSWMYLISNFKEELLQQQFIKEYSDKILPWNKQYLKEKDGSFLYKLVKNN